MMKRLTAILLILVSSILLSLHAYLGSFTRLMADDFCSVYFARRLNMLRYIWYWYLNWGGRYSAIAVDSLIQYIGPVGVRFVPMFVILIWTIVIAFTLHQALKKAITGWEFSLALGFVFMATITEITPMHQQVFYWWNAMRTYIPALIAFTLYVGLLYWIAPRLNTKSKILAASIFSFLLAFFYGGFNETFTAVQVLFFVGLPALGILTRRLRFTDPIFALLGAAMLASSVSLLIMLKAPGTLNRQGYFHITANLMSIIYITVQGYINYWIEILVAPGKITALIGLLLASLWIGTESKAKQSDGWVALYAIGGGIFLSFAALVPSAYSLSEMPAPRTFIVPTFILVSSLPVAGITVGNWLGENTNIMSAMHIQTGLMLSVLLFVSFSIYINTNTLYAERDSYISFAQYWDAADAQIKQAKASGAELVTIPVSKNWAGLDEINDNPKFWVNQCYSLYYQIRVFGKSQ